MHIINESNIQILRESLSLFQDAKQGPDNPNTLDVARDKLTSVFAEYMRLAGDAGRDRIFHDYTAGLSSDSLQDLLASVRRIYRTVLQSSSPEALGCFFEMASPDEAVKVVKLVAQQSGQVGRLNLHGIDGPIPSNLIEKLPFFTDVAHVELMPGAPFSTMVASIVLNAQANTHDVVTLDEGFSWLRTLGEDEEFVRAVEPPLQSLLGLRLNGGPDKEVYLSAYDWHNKPLRSSFCSRLIKVLKGAHQNKAFREWMRLYALEASATCGDGAVNVLGHIEVAWQLHQFTSTTSIEEIVEYFQRVYLLDELETIISSLIENERATNGADDHTTKIQKSREDEAEAVFRLFIKMEMQKHFPLPLDVLYARHGYCTWYSESHVTQAKDALTRIKGDKKRFFEFLVRNQFWIDQLKQRFAGEWEEKLKSFQEKQDELDERKSLMIDQNYQNQVKALKNEFDAAEHAWVCQKTTEVTHYSPPPKEKPEDSGPPTSFS